jgi:phosphatidylserine decarboxylase
MHIQDPHIKNWAFNKYRDPVLIATTMIFLLAAAGLFFFPGWPIYLLLAISLPVWLIIVWFFRDPARQVVDRPGLIVGPADGEVVSIEPFTESRYLNTETIRVSMFLSLFDVHVQRAPVAGEVTLVDYQPGKFLQAFKPEASEVNEYIAMGIKTPYGQVLVKQISGIVARRCYNYAQPGDQLSAGQRFGHIKFGSRVDLFIPPQAEILVKVGDKVAGGLTSIAQLSDENYEEIKS